MALKKFLSITKVFGNKWHPTHSKKEFLTSFSIEQWSSIETSEKAAHTLQACKICQTKHPAISQSFPLRSSKHKKLKSPEINFTPQDLSNSIQFGSKLLKEADSICQTQFQKSVQQVIEETPRSSLITKPNCRVRQIRKRRILREIKENIQSDMNTDGDMLVLQNRLSWNRFDKVRKSQGLTGKKRKMIMDENGQEVEPVSKRRHGCTSANLNIDKEQLMEEAHTWQPDQQVNWSQLKHGKSGPSN